MFWEALRYAFEHQLQICISCLDLKNAYGSVRHSLVQFALDWYHVPKFVKVFEEVGEKIEEAIKAYIESVQAGTFPEEEHSYHFTDKPLQQINRP